MISFKGNQNKFSLNPSKELLMFWREFDMKHVFCGTRSLFSIIFPLSFASSAVKTVLISIKKWIFMRENLSCTRAKRFSETLIHNSLFCSVERKRFPDHLAYKKRHRGTKCTKIPIHNPDDSLRDPLIYSSLFAFKVANNMHVNAIGKDCWCSFCWNKEASDVFCAARG